MIKEARRAALEEGGRGIWEGGRGGLEVEKVCVCVGGVQGRSTD